MNNMNLSEAESKLTEGRLALLIKLPFFGYLAMRLAYIEYNPKNPQHVNDLPNWQGTTATDGSKFFYDAKHIINMSLNDLMFEIAHEIMHIVTRTTTRFPIGGCPGTWNYASDIVIDIALIATKLSQSKVSQQVITKDIQEKYKDWITEKVYYDLMKNHQPQQNTPNGKGKGNGEGNHQPSCCNGGSTEGDRKCNSFQLTNKANTQEKQKWKQHIIEAAKHSEQKNKGNLPAGVQEWIAQLSTPSVSWTDHLRNKVSQAFKGRYTWNKPNRRSSGLGIRLPSRNPTKMGVIVAFDTSGSVSDQELKQYATECYEILRTCGAHYIRVYFHDVNCYHIEDYTKETITKLKVTKGGTSHVDVLNKIKENETKVGLCIAFTDLGTSFPNDPEYPILWAYTGTYGDNATVPYGKKIKVEIKN